MSDATDGIQQTTQRHNGLVVGDKHVELIIVGTILYGLIDTLV